jgi:hypothetical protein
VVEIPPKENNIYSIEGQMVERLDQREVARRVENWRMQGLPPSFWNTSMKPPISITTPPEEPELLTSSAAYTYF